MALEPGQQAGSSINSGLFLLAGEKLSWAPDKRMQSEVFDSSPDGPVRQTSILGQLPHGHGGIILHLG